MRTESGGSVRKWRRAKGIYRPHRFIARRVRFHERNAQEVQLRIGELESQLRQLENKFKIRRDGCIQWQAVVVFSVLHELLQCLHNGTSKQLLQICAGVGTRTIRRPCARVVYNVYTSWRLTRRFAPLHRGRSQLTLFDRNPILKRKAVKWTRRRLFKRKVNEPALTGTRFLEFMNALFIKYDVFENPNAPAPDRKHLQWKAESTAVKYMHAIKLQYGFYQKGYCDGHEREDVIAARDDYAEVWYRLEQRMHLWFKGCLLYTSDAADE